MVHFSPPQPALEGQTHVIWDPYQPIDKKQKDALAKFIKDRKKKRHTVEFDNLLKKFFQLFMSNGGWLKDKVCIIHIYV